MARKITLALVGRGHWGQTYQKTIDSMDGILLPEKFVFGRDYKENFKKVNPRDIDGVIIAATTSAHFEIAKYLLNKGFHNLLIEKPLTQTFKQAEELNRIAGKIPEAKILVGHLMLYDPAWNSMEEASKTLGKISKIRYTALKGPPVKEGTILQDASPHPLYLLMKILGKPISISAKTKESDNIELTLKFRKGAIGIANIGAIYPRRIRQIEIEGKSGSLILNEFVNPRELFYTSSGKTYRLYFPVNITPLKQEIKEFVNLINGKGSKVPLSSGIEVVKLIDLAEQSLMQNGKTILL